MEYVQDKDDPVVTLKRRRNTLAARKYRQKRIDRIADLEDEVDKLKSEREELRIKLARQEAETAALKEMLRARGGS
jgi:predicted nuclease with TOPRIM domain